MRYVQLGIASALAASALILPLTASSASAQARVEVDGWWTTETAYDQAPRPGYVDPRGRVDLNVGQRGWDAQVVVLNHDRRRTPYAYRPAWRNVRWNVRFDRVRRHRFDRVLNQRNLRDLLGRRTTNRIKDHAKWIGARGRLSGRWVQVGPRGRILQVRTGRTPVAELIAFGGDRRVDVVRLNVRRWRNDYDRYDRYDGYDRYGDGRYYDGDDDYYDDDDYDDDYDDRDRRRRRGRK